MRRLIVVLLALALLVGGAMPAWAATGTPVMLDGQQVAIVEDAETEGIALDQFAKAIGAEYKWDAARHEATVVLGHRSIIMWADSPKAVLNGMIRTQATAPVLRGDTLLAPASVVAEALGLYVAGKKDGALVLRSGLGLIQSTKAPDFNADQIMSLHTLTSMSMTDPMDPQNSESMGLAMEQKLHKYQDDLTLRIHMTMADEPPMALEMAYIAGESYLKDESGKWNTTGISAPPMEQVSEAFAALWAGSVNPENPELQEAVVTVTGTSEMDGVKVVHVMVSLTESGIMPALGILMGLGEAPDEEGVKLTVERFVQTYAIDPETGMVHDAHTEYFMRASDASGMSLEVENVSGMRVQPVSVPIELPADFPR